MKSLVLIIILMIISTSGFASDTGGSEEVSRILASEEKKDGIPVHFGRYVTRWDDVEKKFTSVCIDTLSYEQMTQIFQDSVRKMVREANFIALVNLENITYIDQDSAQRFTRQEALDAFYNFPGLDSTKMKMYPITTDEEFTVWEVEEVAINRWNVFWDTIPMFYDVWELSDKYKIPIGEEDMFVFMDTISQYKSPFSRYKDEKNEEQVCAKPNANWGLCVPWQWVLDEVESSKTQPFPEKQVVALNAVKLNQTLYSLDILQQQNRLLQYRLVNAQGQMLKQGFSSDKHISIDTRNISSGVYQLKLSYREQQKVYSVRLGGE